MIERRPFEKLGKSDHGWLKANFHFSFADYRNNDRVHWGALRVWNNDRIAPQTGFPPHPHRDMEIVTYILSGALQHKDSIGTGSMIKPGEIQRMSAGKGIVHSEFNASRERPVHLLQIWIEPSERGIAPSYEQKTIDPQAVTNKFARIAAPDPRESEVRLVQDAEIWAAQLDTGVEAIRPLSPGRRAWLQVAKGEIVVGPHTLKTGDALAVTDEDSVSVRSKAPSELLLFDMA
jgi:redox-sensitive bicupin YhaK (pirin superfamily)